MKRIILIIRNLWNSHIDFNYKTACVLAFILYICYIIVLLYKREKQNKVLTKKDYIYGLLFVVYFTVLMEMTVLNRTVRDTYRFNLELFWSYKKTLLEKNMELGAQILANIMAFVPWGILVPAIWDRKEKFYMTIGSAMCTSVAIELFQLITRCGLCELDDIFDNVIGSLIGYGIYLLGKVL